MPRETGRVQCVGGCERWMAPRLSGMCDDCLGNMSSTKRKVRREVRAAGVRAGEVERDKALDRVEDAADPNWMDAAYKAIVAVATEQAEFITDDVWAMLAVTGFPDKPKEARVLGAIMGKASRAGVMENTGRTQKTADKVSHANPVRVWRSRLYDGGEL